MFKVGQHDLDEQCLDHVGDSNYDVDDSDDHDSDNNWENYDWDKVIKHYELQQWICVVHNNGLKPL